MQVREVFAAKDVYFAALLGGIVGYFGFVALVAVSMLAGSGQIMDAAKVVAVGLIFGIVPAAVVSAAIVAPVGMVIAISALGWLPKSRWHGAITGVLTAIIITAALLALFGAQWREAPDTGTLAFLVSALMIAAATGSLTQRQFLRQPARS